MADFLIGGPEKPEEREGAGFYIHKNLTCYLDTRADGVFLLGEDPKKKKIIFEKPFSTTKDAMDWMEELKRMLGDANDSESGSTEQ